MARGLNKVMLIGNLGRDPEIRFTPTGTPVANISLGTSEQWKDKKTGQPVEHTEWHRLVLFNRLAEIARDYLKKGSQIYIEGQQRTRKWQDSNGVARYVTEVVVRDLQMLGARRDQAAAPMGGQAPGARQQEPSEFDGMPPEYDEAAFTVDYEALPEGTGFAPSTE